MAEFQRTGLRRVPNVRIRARMSGQLRGKAVRGKRYTDRKEDGEAACTSAAPLTTNGADNP